MAQKYMSVTKARVACAGSYPHVDYNGALNVH